MTKVGIILAMEEEIVALKKKMILENEYEIFELKFYEGHINNLNYIMVESGVGKVNAARTTQILIDNFKCDFILNIGVAGGVSDSLDVGDIVIANSLVQHDFDITAFNHEKGYIPKVGTYIECDKYLVNLAIQIAQECKIKYKMGVIASGDIFCTEKKMAEKINQKFNALATEMEGASIAQVCFLNHIPFLIVRSISDTPNSNNVITYEEFLNSSCELVASYLKKILEYIEI